MSLILDSSTTMARAFPEERTQAILDVFHQISIGRATVPDLWRIEVANSLNVGIRRGRIRMETRNDVLKDLDSLPIEIDRVGFKFAWRQTLQLADKHKLTVYDATYLELALRLSLPLATLDRELRIAAQAEGVPLLGL
jgi:predicted nucleic acid-binding protein